MHVSLKLFTPLTELQCSSLLNSTNFSHGQFNNSFSRPRFILLTTATHLFFDFELGPHRLFYFAGNRYNSSDILGKPKQQALQTVSMCWHWPKHCQGLGGREAAQLSVSLTSSIPWASLETTPQTLA